jgi:hypothetical protein
MYAYYEHFVPHTPRELRQQTQEMRLLEAAAAGLVPQQPPQSPIARLLGNFPARKQHHPRKN